ncbi:LysR substrate-binding domain-containing protein [Neisseriaceae bacterium ESL0693]|nr:LysR substrate-binding domain-containing protein [Neisseriaceae bacterium ESL0693]
MKLQQLRYALEVYRQNLNVSEAAESLYTSQPGISKQIRLLEEELAVPIFVRHGKRMVAVTAPGKVILETADRILREVQNIKRIGTEFADHATGTLTVATTHTQARYALTDVIAAFVQRFPQVQLSIVPVTSAVLDKMVLDGEADFAIGTELLTQHAELRKLTCYPWNRSVIVPDNHPLLALNRPLQLQDISCYPVVTYDASFPDTSRVAHAFRRAQIPLPKIVLASADTEIIKTYVRSGLGIGLVASVVFEPQKDHHLHCLNVAHLFEPSFSHIVLRQDVYLRGFGYEFLNLFAPALTRECIEAALYQPIHEDFSI